MGRSQLCRIPGRGKSMCKGPEVGKVFMCAFSKEASAVEQREGKVEGKTKRWLKPDPKAQFNPTLCQLHF